MTSTFDPFEFKPDISASSRKLYTFNLTKLNNGKDIKNLNFLAKPEIMEKLESADKVLGSMREVVKSVHGVTKFAKKHDASLKRIFKFLNVMTAESQQQ